MANKKATTKKPADKKVEEKEYVESTPRFKIGEMVSFFMDTSIEIEKGEVIGVFTIPTADVKDKNYAYQIEHEYLDSKKKKKKGMCVPKSENIIGDVSSDFKNKFTEFGLAKLDDRIAENEENLKLLAEQMQKDKDFEKEVHKIIKNLKDRKKEVA